MAKTAAFGVVHLGIAFSVTYALTGNLAASGAVTLIEPVCNMVAHYFFDKYWDHPRARAVRERVRGWHGAPAALPAAPRAARP